MTLRRLIRWVLRWDAEYLRGFRDALRAGVPMIVTYPDGSERDLSPGDTLEIREDNGALWVVRPWGTS